jgi:hypothetical protein
MSTYQGTAQSSTSVSDSQGVALQVWKGRAPPKDVSILYWWNVADNRIYVRHKGFWREVTRRRLLL